MKDLLCCMALAIMIVVIVNNGSAPTWLVAVYWGLVSGYWAVNRGGDKHE